MVSKRIPIIAANWKMNLMPHQVKPYLDVLLANLPSELTRKVILAGSPLFLEEMVRETKNTLISISAEDCFYKNTGAYTGAVSPKCLNEIGVEYVIAGHSERWKYFHETDKSLNKKVHAILDNGMKPIICCDETLIRSQANHHGEWVVSPVISALKGISYKEAKNIIMAYEPTWAIGTGSSASAEEAEEGCRLIRDTISRLYSAELSENIPILYGGSVSNKNIRKLMRQNDIDGVLVGTDSLDPYEFLGLINY